ncbi:MAG: hypothetical protein LBL42_01185, partial [Tannerella sp.]|nr:hypothetical protein [Tannerella sp.]
KSTTLFPVSFIITFIRVNSNCRAGRNLNLIPSVSIDDGRNAACTGSVIIDNGRSAACTGSVIIADGCNAACSGSVSIADGGNQIQIPTGATI